jgi:hypothetical protein
MVLVAYAGPESPAAALRDAERVVPSRHPFVECHETLLLSSTTTFSSSSFSSTTRLVTYITPLVT